MLFEVCREFPYFILYAVLDLDYREPPPNVVAAAAVAENVETWMPRGSKCCAFGVEIGARLKFAGACYAAKLEVPPLRALNEDFESAADIAPVVKRPTSE